MEGLSEFQKRVVAFSLRESAAMGVSLQKEVLVDARSGESLVCLKAGATSIEIWIYPDGANILTREIDRRIETQDFDSAASMEETAQIEIRAVLASAG